LSQIREYKNQGIESKLFIIGQKGIAGLKRKAVDAGAEVVKTYTQVAAEITAVGAEDVALDIAEYYIEGKIDKIEVFTTKFKNMMSYTAETWDLLPVSIDMEDGEDIGIDPLMEFEPSEHSILKKVVPLYITNTIFQALLEAQASELASRMTAMSAAANNAEEMIRKLTIDYNKARQWAITQEILEVVSGADALKG
jgi:F-type H+-transporting ATPase subunit gamma